MTVVVGYLAGKSGVAPLHLAVAAARTLRTSLTVATVVPRPWTVPSPARVDAEYAAWADQLAADSAKEAQRELAARGYPLRMAVNVSPVQFRDPGFLEVVRRAIADAGIDPALLELEITESAIISDKVRALQVLRRIKALGISIAMDDFGTGYSSLSCVKRFPIDELKIDRSFVVGLGTDDGAMAVTRAIVALARSLRLHLVAEGIETEAQAEVLRSMGCDELQGYLFSRPVPGVEIRRLLSAHREKAVSVA